MFYIGNVYLYQKTCISYTFTSILQYNKYTQRKCNTDVYTQKNTVSCSVSYSILSASVPLPAPALALDLALGGISRVVDGSTSKTSRV